MAFPLVVFFHRLGLKLLEVGEQEEVAELVDITSINPPDIVENLSEYSGKEIYLLTSDSICHVFHHEFPFQETPLTREFVFKELKDRFPQHLQSSNWDYKTISTDTKTIEIIVFALNDDFQSLIAKVVSQLQLKVVSLEPESIAVTRHSNPIVGITLAKNTPHQPQLQVKPKIPEPKKISNVPQSNKNNSNKSIVVTIICLTLFVAINIFIYQKYYLAPAPTPSIATPLISPSPTITPVVKKAWTSLSLLIENGTSKAGFAGSIAVKFEEEGIVDVKTGNASRNDYSTSKLTFKTTLLKDSYYERFNKIFPVSQSDVEVNSDLETDVVLTLGTL